MQIRSQRRSPLLALALPLLAASLAPPTRLAAEELPPMPAELASFGAAVAGNDLYVFGGHVGQTHQHSIENLSHAFWHLDLAAPAKGWEKVGEVAGLQGLPLVTHGRRVCRVGGLAARNHQGEAEDLVSSAEVACFDPATGAWQGLPPLPAPRSSHDAVVLGDRLYVVGGWQLRGAGQEHQWHQTMAVLDLGQAAPAWRSIPQPFERRALAAASARGKIYALGGLGKDGTSRQVDVYDPATGAWSAGPELPPMAERMKGFGVAAAGAGDRLYLSGADGVVHALTGDTWEQGLGKLATPRFFHRLLLHQGRLLVLGGAGHGGHLASVESLPLAALVQAPPGASSPPAPMAARGNWPGFRGDGAGHAPSPELPLHWSADDNVAWRASLPGYGQSAPVVWDGRVEAFDAASGARLWVHEGIEKNTVPSVVVDGELVVAASSEPGQSLALTRGTEVRWRSDGTTSGFASPLLHGGCALFVNKAGASTCLDRATGESRWTHRLPAESWASPIAAGDLAFIFSKGGQTTILRTNPESPQVVAENSLPLGDTLYAVAAVRGALLFRWGKELVRVGR